MPTLIDNLIRRIEVIAILLELAEKTASNTRKSVFYRSAMIAACSVAEALCYEFIRRNTTSPHKINETIEYQELCTVKGSALSLSNDLFICKKNKKDLLLGEADFGKYIIFLKNSQLISYPKYLQINWIRKERNRIHVQGVRGRDVGYTKAKIDRVGDAIDYLLSRLP